MHTVFAILGLWLLAFTTLALALVLLNFYSNLIDYDFTLNCIGQETMVAGICALIQAASVWAVVTHAPGAARALFIPFLLIALIYTLTHLDNWRRFNGVIVLVFQLAIGGIMACLWSRDFGAALLIAAGFAGALTIIGSIARGL